MTVLASFVLVLHRLGSKLSVDSSAVPSSVSSEQTVLNMLAAVSTEKNSSWTTIEKKYSVPVQQAIRSYSSGLVPLVL